MLQILNTAPTDKSAGITADPGVSHLHSPQHNSTPSTRASGGAKNVHDVLILGMYLTTLQILGERHQNLLWKELGKTSPFVML